MGRQIRSQITAARIDAMKTTPRNCNRKKRFATRDEAEAVAARADVTLRAYKCELCKQFHLTSRTKGMKLPPDELERRASLT